MAPACPDEGFQMTWAERPALDRLIWLVIESGAELLTHGTTDRIRECRDESEGCGWLFLDTSKNGRRRWCDMRSCGNVAKAHRHRARTRSGDIAARAD